MDEPTAKLQTACTVHERGRELLFGDDTLRHENATQRPPGPSLFAQHRKVVLGLVPCHASRIAFLNDLPYGTAVGHEVDVIAPEQPRDRQGAFGQPVKGGHEKDALGDAIGHEHEVRRQQRGQPGTALEYR